MTIYVRPDATIPVWAESGDKVQPTDPEIQTGWPLSNTPPSRQRFNWVLGETAQAARYLLQRGFPEWSADEDYPINARVQYAGDVYTALAANTNIIPGTAPLSWALGGSNKAVTPPQFDNDTSVATTAFVQKALGNFQVGTPIAVVGNFLASDAGGVFYITAAGSHGLPALASVPAGATFTILATVTGVVIDPSGGEQILSGPTPVNTLTLNTGDSVVLSKIGAFWTIVGGTSAGRGSEGDFAKALAANGYQRLPSGLIIQWGVASIAGVAGSSFTYPLAFPTAARSLVGVVDNASSTNDVCTAFNVSATQGAFRLNSRPCKTSTTRMNAGV